jgi:hypothetical protein
MMKQGKYGPGRWLGEYIMDLAFTVNTFPATKMTLAILFPETFTFQQ